MKRIFALSILSLLFTVGCGVAGPEASPAAMQEAEKLTHDARLAGESGGAASDGAELTADLRDHTNITVHCNRRCILGCGPLGDEACAHSCCEVY